MINYLYRKASLTPAEIERLNPPWDYGMYEDEDGRVLTEWYDHPDWLSVGYIPSPRSKWRWFVYHLCHGVMMRYPLWKVIIWSLLESQQKRNKDGYIDMVGTQMWYVGSETKDFTEVTIDRNGRILDE